MGDSSACVTLSDSGLRAPPVRRVLSLGGYAAWNIGFQDHVGCKGREDGGGLVGKAGTPLKQRDRVLIVGGDRDFRTMLELAFSYDGDRFRVSSAPDGRSALLQIAVVQPDLLVLYVTTAPDDGWDTLVQIRALYTVPVIALSGVKDEEVRTRSLALGADSFLLAPVSLRELQTAARGLLQRDEGVEALVP